MPDGRRPLRLALLLTMCAIAVSCATTAGPGQPTLTLEQHSLRIPLTLEADGSVTLAERPPLVGRLDLSPILKAEGMQPGGKTRPTIQLMVHYGRLYVVADDFRNLWEITPRPGTTTASYRPIAVVPGSAPLKGVRLSRYGSDHASCLRLDRTTGAPVFITAAGEARDACR